MGRRTRIGTAWNLRIGAELHRAGMAAAFHRTVHHLSTGRTIAAARHAWRVVDGAGPLTDCEVGEADRIVAGKAA